MKKLFCIILLIFVFAPECGAMNNMKNLTKKLLLNNNNVKKFNYLISRHADEGDMIAASTKISLFLVINGTASLIAGSVDGLFGGLMQGKAPLARSIAFLTMVMPLPVCRYFFASNLALQGALYGIAYKDYRKLEKH